MDAFLWGLTSAVTLTPHRRQRAKILFRGRSIREAMKHPELGIAEDWRTICVDLQTSILRVQSEDDLPKCPLLVAK
jgi:hypothetical protein